MKISCPNCVVGQEFITDVPCRIEVFVDPKGKLTKGMTGEIVFMPNKVHPGQKFTCTACGYEAMMEHV